MYVFIFLGKKDNFGVFEEIFGDFWDCDDYVQKCVLFPTDSVRL